MTRHRFHGDPARFEVVARFIADRFADARYVADVAGGQGMLTRILRKHFGFEAEVIDPRGWALRGVPTRAEVYTPAMADYYDLVVGLHPDQALRSVVESAGKAAVLVVPCCNFWNRQRRLGRDELIEQISEFHQSLGGTSERVTLAFSGPANHGLILRPPQPDEGVPPPVPGRAMQTDRSEVPRRPPVARGVELPQGPFPRLDRNRGGVRLRTRAASAGPDLLAGAFWVWDLPVRPVMRAYKAGHSAPQALTPRHGHASARRGTIAI